MTTESPLVEHARREMELAGMFDKDADYGGAAAKCIMDLVRLVAGQEHSGASAGLVLGVTWKLLNFETLTPITSNPDEWIDRSDFSNEPLWQSNRNPAVFSKDGGKTWYDLNNEAAKAELKRAFTAL